MQGTVAIASVAATAAVAIVVPIVSARLEQSRLRGQLQHERLDELRSVLDLAALALTHAEEDLRSAEFAVERSQAGDAAPDSEDASKNALALGAEALRAVSEQWVRMSIRLGPDSELVILYGKAHAALSDELEVLLSAFDGGPLSDDPAGWREAVVPLDEARARFDESQQAFSTGAARLVGPFGGGGLGL
jgi:hypothetical protein